MSVAILRDSDHAPSNASLQLLPEAGATQERTLEAVSCKALFGLVLERGSGFAR